MFNVESQEWDVDRLLEFLRKEINSREFCSYMSNLKSGDKPDRRSKNDFSAAVLFSGNSGGTKLNPHNLTCTFCKQNDTSSKCDIIADVSS